MTPNLTELALTLPPMMVGFLNVQTSARYFSLFYSSPFPRWHDGINQGTASHTIYVTFINHVTVAIELWNYNLGSEEAEATHHLLCDRQEQKIYVGLAQNVQHFLDAQKQLMAEVEQSEPEISQMQERLQNELDDIEIEAMMRSGEWYLRVAQIRRYELLASQEISKWLNQKVNRNLMTRYMAYARSGEYRAIQQLQKFET
jgi:hypothetical protein